MEGHATDLPLYHSVGLCMPKLHTVYVHNNTLPVSTSMPFHYTTTAHTYVTNEFVVPFSPSVACQFPTIHAHATFSSCPMLKTCNVFAVH